MKKVIFLVGLMYCLVHQLQAQCPVNIGADRTVCFTQGGYIAPMLDTATTMYSSYSWSTTGSGYFTNNTSMYAYYYFGAADETSGPFWIKLQASTSCGIKADSFMVTVNVANTVDAGPATTEYYCSGTYSFQLNGASSTATRWTTSGQGSFVPNDTDLNAQYVFAANDADRVHIQLETNNANACGRPVDSLVLVKTAQPDISIEEGRTITVCGYRPFTIHGNVTGGYDHLNWDANGLGSLNTNNDSTVVVYTPDASDTEVTIMFWTSPATNCVIVIDTITINFQPDLYADAGSGQYICNNQASLMGSTIGSTSYTWSTSGTGTFDNNTSLTPVYTASTADIQHQSVILTLTANRAGCPASDDTMSIVFASGIQVNAGTDITKCGSDSVYLNGAVSAIATSVVWSSSGTGIFFPSANVPSARYSLSGADKVAGSVQLILTASAGSCAPVSDTLTVTYIDVPQPTVYGGGNKNATGPFTLTATITGASAVKWNTEGTGTFSPDDHSLTTTYTPSADDFDAGKVIFNVVTTDGACSVPATDLVTAFLGTQYFFDGVATAGSGSCGTGYAVAYKKQADGSYRFLKAQYIYPGTGNYIVDTIPGGTYLAQIIPTDPAIFEHYLPTYYGNTASWEDAQSLQLNTNLTNINFSLVPYTTTLTGNDTISGQLVLSNPSARIAGQSSNPLANAIVYLNDMNGNHVGYTSTDDQGNFSFSHVPAGQYKISVDYPGVQVGTITTATSDGNPSTKEIVQLSVSRVASTTETQSAVVSKKIFIAPNPAQSVISISLDEKNIVQGQLRIVDAMGATQYTVPVTLAGSSPLQISVANLNSGCYMIEVIAGEANYKTKFIKY